MFYIELLVIQIIERGRHKNNIYPQKDIIIITIFLKNMYVLGA